MDFLDLLLATLVMNPFRFKEINQIYLHGSVHLQNLIILIMSLPIFGDKSVGAGGLWLSPCVL